MKKVLLTLTMLLFAFTGVMRASAEQGNVRADQVIEQGFEDGLGDWTMNHCHSSSGPTSSYGGNTGNYAFRFYYTTNYPQYLISPELDDNDGVNLTFYAARYSSNYPETFMVGYSSTTNDPTEFTWGSEVTCTTMYGAGAYEEYSYDFPAGTKYVSIACTSNDQFYMFVDDITVTATEPAPPTPGEIVEVTIGDPTSTEVSSYIPGYTLYDYAISQQIYTADEIGVAGTIETLTMWLKNNSSYARNINVYMKEVEATEFASNTAWESFTAADMVVSFTMPNENSTPIEVALPLSTPFEYSGAGNLVICFQDVTGSWSSGLGGVVMDAAGNQAIYAYRDGTVYDPSNVGVNGTLLAKKNVVRLAIMTGGDEPATAFTTIPDVVDLGYRPNGAWMAPYTFAIKSNIGATTINALDFSGNYFTYNAELPATVSANNPLVVELSTGTAEEGLVESTMTIMYSGDRDIEQFPVTAYAYDPAEGDVYETAIVVPMELQTEYEEDLSQMNIFKNYDLPYETTDEDAVYQVTFDDDVIFYAGAEEGGVTLYTEDFNGQPGPMVDNNYVYNGPTINPGPVSMWFSYSYTGSNTFFGTSAGGTTVFGYKIPAATLQELGLGNCAITTVEAAAREGSYYDLMILKGGDTPDFNNMVYYQEFDAYTPYYFFDVNLDEPQFLGDDENLWIMLYSDSPYAAYCGRYPVDTQNGKIWYTTNLENWYSNTTYTPVIYTRFLELPTGREVTLNLADMKIRESKPAEGQIAEANGEVMGVAKAQMRSRDAQTLINEGFEGGSMPTGWTTEGNGTWNVGTGDYSSSTGAATGTYNAKITHGTTGNETYLVTPAMDLSNATSATLSCQYVNRSWAGDTDGFGIYYRVNGGTWNELFATSSAHSTWTASGDITLTGLAANYQIGFMMHDNYGYGVGLDDVLVTADIEDTPTPPTPGEPFVPSFEAQIDGMYVPAGTYYVVATGDVLHMAIDEVPAPDQAIVISPADGETNVTTPYLAEWILGDYTEEMQVLVGTQYPPQTALIDWTDYLVESAFIMDLEPNQSYFMQVNARNAAGTTMGEIIAFTTPIDGVTGLEVADDELYPGDAALLTWNANRSFKGYNVYVDGVKWNESLITTNEYAVEGLEYNMLGYDIQVSAVYDAGESAMSEAVTVYMTGVGTVSGHVYDIDEEHPIAGATVMYIGADEYEEMSEAYFVTDEEGFYSGEILAGIYAYGIATEGYDSQTGADVTEVVYMDELEGLDIYTHEFYYPLEQITATDEGDDVLVEWSWTPAELIIDFETGDFSQYEFTQPAQYPWAITTGHAHEGTYSIKSTCEGQASATSQIEATVDVPYDGKMGFWVSVSSESNYDKFHFYIDGVEQGAALSGTVAYAYKEYDVTEGTHTYKWTYQKDSSVNSGDDCAYVDDITLYRYVAPLPPVVGATVYDFEDGTLQGWTNIDADGDGNVWVSSTNPGIYHNSGVSLAGTGHDASQAYVISGSYANQTGQALTPDNYFVSPLISAENGAQIQFYACAQDASYAAEHFGVAVSTSGNTAAADFTTIQEWTMTAKGTQGRTVESEHDIRGLRQGNWYLYTVDLSAYAGQDIYVAIRHFNCTDMFILNVDDITLATGGSKTEDRGNRSLVSYNLYRRNNIDLESVENPELIAEGIDADVYEYIDAEWATLDYGEWQWGIAATYAGYSPLTDRNRDVLFTDDFEDGALTNWSTIDADGDGDTWQNATPAAYGIGDAHSGTNCASSWSWNSITMYPDNWMISPMVEGATSIQYYVATNTAYPDHYGVYASSTGTAASNFTLVFEETAASKGGNGTRSSMTQAGTRAMSDWAEKNIDLPEGTKYVAFRHWNSDDMNYLFIDDVTISGGSAPVPPTPPTPGPTGDGISEILWSNVIDRDMVSIVTFNLSLNNGQSPAGIDMEITGIDFEEEYVFDETGTMTIELRKGVYALEIEPDGYAPIDDALVIDEDEMEFSYTLVEQVGPVAGLYVSPTGWVKWDGIGGGVTPTPPTPGSNNAFTEGFEGGLNGWNVLTVNADGGEWLHSTANPGGYDYSELAHNGAGFAMCYSYVDYVGAYNTDSYLYTPQKYAIQDGSTLSFWADNANDSYPENFSVCIATVDNPTSAADFTQVWSGGAKGTANGGEIVRHQNNRYQNWRSHNIDLSAYAGQEVYIAFHDVNYDAYEIWIDDVELGVVNKGDRAPMKYVVKLDGVVDGETTFPGFQHNVEGMEEGSVHTTAVRPVYVTGNGDWMEYTWTYTSCDNFAGVTDLAAAEQGNDVKLTWTMPGAPGPGPQPGGSTFTEDFEGGLNGWNVLTINADGGEWLHSSNNPGGYDYTSHAHGGTGFAMCYSFVDYVGAFNTDSYMYTPEMYTIGSGSTLTFWADNANDSYPENFSVVISTAANPSSASDFTTVWSGGAKGTRSDGAMVRHNNNRYDNWRSHTVDLSAYAGQTVYIGFHDANYDMYEVWIDDVELSTAKGNRDAWDYVASFTGTSAGQQAVCTDGEYIYTASWQSTPTGGYTFYQYTMDGTFVEGFNISGATGIRDITTDGEYFYGTSGASQIFILDFTTRTLVGTINCSGLTSRHISYDPERDGFWSGNWSTLALYSRTGALVQNGAAPESAYGSAYYKDAEGVEHLFLFCQPNSDAKVYDYNIATNTISGPIFDFAATPGFDGIAGGCFIGEYEGNTCWFGNSQQDPNLIGIYELEAGGPVPPTPVEGILGAMIFQDGEPIAFVEGSPTQYVVEGAASYDATYGVRVVYGGEPDVTYYAMSCMDEVDYSGTVVPCNPVANLTAEDYTYNGNHGALVSWSEPAGATSYKIYVDGELLGSLTGQPIFINFEGTPAGTYTIGVVAVYAECESEMVTVDFLWTPVSVNELSANTNIYPNPTHDNVTIEAQGMRHITVVSALGQVVYDADIEADMTQLNLGQFKAGLYVVRIDTENGTVVKRVSVVK